MTTALDPAILEQKGGIAFGALTGLITAGLIHAGERLGIYRAMAGAGPVTTAYLADKLGLRERIVREWAFQQTAAGVLDYHGETTFELGPEASLVFADESTPNSMAEGFRVLPEILSVVANAPVGFKGLGRTYDSHGEQGAIATAGFLGTWNRTALVSDALPKIPGLIAKLEAGAQVADVGCGAGIGPVSLAKAFPNTSVHGYDNSVHALKLAAENKRAAGVANVTFHNADQEPLPSTPTFDLVMTLDCLHDMARPDLAAAAIRKAIKPDGAWFIVDVHGAPTAAANLASPIAQLAFGFSTFLCLPSSSATEDGMQLGAYGLPEPKMRDLVTNAGFTSFKQVDGLAHPFNAYYEVRP